MGEEISFDQFTSADFAAFGARLRRETALLRTMKAACRTSAPSSGWNSKPG